MRGLLFRDDGNRSRATFSRLSLGGIIRTTLERLCSKTPVVFTNETVSMKINRCWSLMRASSPTVDFGVHQEFGRHGVWFCWTQDCYLDGRK